MFFKHRLCRVTNNYIDSRVTSFGKLRVVVEKVAQPNTYLQIKRKKHLVIKYSGSIILSEYILTYGYVITVLQQN